MRILGSDAGGRVDHQQCDVGPFDGLERAQDAELLDAGLDLAALADARRVDQRDLQPVHFDLGVGCIARRPGDRADDRPLLPDQLVQQAGLAGVRFTDDGDLDAFIFLFGGLLWESSHQRVEQVTGPGPVHRRDRIGLAQSQLVELGCFITSLAGFCLVDHNEDRWPESPIFQFLL